LRGLVERIASPPGFFTAKDGGHAACWIITNSRTGSIVGHRIRIASSFYSRLKGLLGQRAFSPGDGLLIRPSNAVHTLGMVFSIDLIALDHNCCVIGLKPNVLPQRIALFGFDTRDILELPAGQIQRASVRVGDRLDIQSGT
jgi:uncharacterized membrane protein (UPF0127 family)